jgi:nitrite reductase/ring-hydroxylating ferredoxin subunit
LTGAALFATSLLLRKKKSREMGRIVGVVGYAVMAYATHLGGKLVYENRVGVDRTDGQVFPKQFAAVLPETSLMDGKPTRAIYQGSPILLVRREDHLFAMAETCSHFSGPLSEGKLEGESVVCPYHFSRFALDDGRVLDGPAVHPQPCLEVRTRNGQIEVRHVPALSQVSCDHDSP